MTYETQTAVLQFVILKELLTYHNQYIMMYEAETAVRELAPHVQMSFSL